MWQLNTWMCWTTNRNPNTVHTWTRLWSSAKWRNHFSFRSNQSKFYLQYSVCVCLTGECEHFQDKHVFRWWPSEMIFVFSQMICSCWTAATICSLQTVSQTEVWVSIRTVSAVSCNSHRQIDNKSLPESSTLRCIHCFLYGFLCSVWDQGRSAGEQPVWEDRCGELHTRGSCV